MSCTYSETGHRDECELMKGAGSTSGMTSSLSSDMIAVQYVQRVVDAI